MNDDDEAAAMLKQAMAWIAVSLFSREEVDKSPTLAQWCTVAKDRFGDSRAGPWYRYSKDGHWNCKICNTDPYLNEDGDKYLLSPSGTLEIMKALGAHGIKGFYIDRDPIPGVAWSCALFPKRVITIGHTPEEAVVLAAYALLRVDQLLSTEQ